MKKIFLSKSKWKKAFTLVEILVAILILSIIIVTGFELYTKAIASKIKIDEQANLEKNIYYFSEKIFQLVKKWWTLDYEEYFNRQLISSESSYENWKWFLIVKPENDWSYFKNWHFSQNTWFWNFWFNWIISTNNFWEWFYYCISESNYTVINWCYNVAPNNINSKFTDITWVWRNYIWSPQRYWQYSFQFIDYNSDADNDKWDENGDKNIMRDDDDKHLWNWPVLYWIWNDLKELYLLSWDKKTRTLIRWNIKQDDFAKTRNSSFTCDHRLKSDYSPLNPINFTYCLWTIEYLQLEWKDWWMDHNSQNIDSDWSQNDWVIDTWLIAKNFSWKQNDVTANSVIAWSNNENYRKPLFNDSINISDFKVFAYPNIDSSKVWDISEEEQKKFLISPYVVLSFEIRPSWKVKSKISWWEIKPVRFNMTVNLTEVFSK